MPTFAAIDIGSNSCRLKIAKVVAHQLRTVHEDREVTRLGTSVFESGLISPESMAATLRTLKRFQRSVQMHGAERIRVVATSAVRDARNADAFQAWVKAETGWNLETISGLEEGRLIHLGVTGLEPGTGGRLVLVDLGGGSCEITLSDHKRIKETVSLPLGAVRLTEEFLQADPPTADGLTQMRKYIDRELRQAHKKLHLEDIGLVIATSGTAAALANAIWTQGHAESGRVSKATGKPAKKKGKKSSRKSAAKRLAPPLQAMKVPAPPSAALAPSKIDPASLALTEMSGISPARQVRKLANKLALLSLPERAMIPGIGPMRAEIIVAGAQVYAQLLDSFELAGFRYSQLGLRDGILMQMLAEQDARAIAHREFEHVRWQSILETAKRYGVDLRQADAVRTHAVQLFRELKPLHQLPPEYESWMAAAAMLCDTGKFINHQGHHRHTQYLISSSELYGYTRMQRTVISAIARYMGKSRPQPGDRALRNIPPAEHPYVSQAVVMLRLAVALNQDRASDVLRVATKIYPKRVHLVLQPGRTGAELELWSARKEADYFREIFGRELFPTLA
jgi:exopolyphosphatase / guanosine-5'-triphosphate,3'-diphosphate pyrophosphatase